MQLNRRSHLINAEGYFGLSLCKAVGDDDAENKSAENDEKNGGNEEKSAFGEAHRPALRDGDAAGQHRRRR